MPGRSSKRPPPDVPASSDDVEEIALFLVRIFGDDAREVAAHRAEHSDQAEDWKQVGQSIEALLEGAPARRRPRRGARRTRGTT
jgi:hypothetical protein